MAERLSPATAAWIGLGVGIATYELLCPEGETLTEGFRRGMKTKVGRAALTGATLITAAHLTETIPEQWDPFEQGLSRIRQRVVKKIYKQIDDLTPESE